MAKKTFRYGIDKTPNNWHELAEVIRQSQEGKKTKGSFLKDRLDSIEKLLKDKK